MLSCSYNILVLPQRLDQQPHWTDSLPVLPFPRCLWCCYNTVLDSDLWPSLCCWWHYETCGRTNTKTHTYKCLPRERYLHMNAMEEKFKVKCELMLSTHWWTCANSLLTDSNVSSACSSALVTTSTFAMWKLAFNLLKSICLAPSSWATWWSKSYNWTNSIYFSPGQQKHNDQR